MSDNDNNSHGHHDPNDNTTGHDWDGIQELKNPPPKWWTVGFYAGMFFVTMYYIIYPSSPFNAGFEKVINNMFGMQVFVNGHSKGIMALINSNPYYQGEQWTQQEIDALKAKGYKDLQIKAGDLKYQDGWTYVNEARDETQEIENVRKPYMDKLKTMSVRDILANDEMKQFALGRARVLFGDNCAPCHGSGGGGRVGGDYSFPNLTDDDWLYGGWPEKIVETITQGRQGMMPAKGGRDDLTDEQIGKLADFILAMSDGKISMDKEGKLSGENVEQYSVAHGIFQETCFACHGKNAKGAELNGDYYIGAANLTDKIWRFGGDRKTIIETITKGRQAKMPTFGEKLDETTIKILAVKVHELGGGMDKPPI